MRTGSPVKPARRGPHSNAAPNGPRPHPCQTDDLTSDRVPTMLRSFHRDLRRSVASPGSARITMPSHGPSCHPPTGHAREWPRSTRSCGIRFAIADRVPNLRVPGSKRSRRTDGFVSLPGPPRNEVHMRCWSDRSAFLATVTAAGGDVWRGDDHRRAIGVLDDRVRDAAQQQRSDAGQSARSEHDRVGVEAVGVFHDCFGDVARRRLWAHILVHGLLEFVRGDAETNRERPHRLRARRRGRSARLVR